MVIFRLETILLWSHRKHKHFVRDSRRRASCIQYKKKMPSAAASRPGITGMRRNTSFLECTLAQMSSPFVRLQHTHTEGLRAPGSRASSPPHIKHTNCHWQEKPRRRNLTTQNMQSWPIFFSLWVSFFFCFFIPCPHTGWGLIADSAARGVNPVVLWLP